jgi:hypothetical protein
MIFAPARRASAASLVLRTRAGGDIELRAVALLQRRHQIDGVGRGHRDLQRCGCR